MGNTGLRILSFKNPQWLVGLSAPFTNFGEQNAFLRQAVHFPGSRNVYSPTYCLLLKKMQLTFTALIYSPFNTRDDGRGKTFRFCLKHLSLYHCMTLCSLVAICWVSHL